MREFWICPSNARDGGICDRSLIYLNEPTKPINYIAIHVIEKSAYDSVVADRDRLRKELEDNEWKAEAALQEDNKKLTQERDSIFDSLNQVTGNFIKMVALKDKVSKERDVMKDALEFCANGWDREPVSAKRAQDTLRNLEKTNKTEGK